jgi:hypothetical protein
MAKDDYTSIIALAAIGGIAWYGYEQGWFSSLFGTAAAATTGTPAAAINCPSPNTLVAGVCVAPVTCPSPNTIINGICTAPVVAAAGGSSSTTAAPQAIPTASVSVTDQPWYDQVAALASTNSLDMDQWDYYYNQIFPSAPITGTQVNAMLAALTNLGQTRSTPMTMPQWYWLLTAGGGGVSGLGMFGNYFGIPASAIHGGW